MSSRIYTRADLATNDFQPRFAAWLRATPGGRLIDYMDWINRNVPRYLEAVGQPRVSNHDECTAWLEVNAGEGK